MAADNNVKQQKPADKAKTQKPAEKQGNWFTNFFKKIGKAFYNMYHELKKVTWPSKSALINYSLVVLAFLVVMGVIIGLFDVGAKWLVRLITG